LLIFIFFISWSISFVVLFSFSFIIDSDDGLHGRGIKEDVDLQNDMIMSLIELLERKGICTFQEWAQIMNERIMTEE
jgi:hypothetical protein